MGDSSGTKPNDIPSWQLLPASTTSTTPESESHRLSDGSVTPQRTILIEKASKFLENTDIKLASTERKRNFLRTKGLTDEEINELLARENEVSKPAQVKDGKRIDQEVEEESAANVADDAIDAPQSSDINIMDDYIDSEPLPPAKDDRPPIITYPEFLLQSRKPQPLMTTGRLVSGLYLASGTAAAIYGLSKYILEPMVESLTLSRHSFFESASSNIDTLNDRLASVVSKIPDGINDEERDASEESSQSSDPAHFFSRTIATQTSPRLSRSTSTASLNEKEPPSVIALHADQVSRMHDLLAELNTEESDVVDPVKENFRMLTEYLNDLPMLGRVGQIRTAKQFDQSSESKTDGVAKVKAEIKSVKGALLSARNFPAGITSR